jgi:DNA-binding helix-hairpin-helix protein with protein kinase domain
MGSIGIASGDGRMNRAELEQVRGTADIMDRLSRINTIVIYPGKTGAKSANATAKKWGERLGLESPSRGYAIAMTGATREQKERLLNGINSALNRTQERDESYRAYADRLVNQAKAWKAANGRGALTRPEERVIRELANSTKQRATIDKLIQNDRDKNNRYFGGNMRTRRLTKRDN